MNRRWMLGCGLAAVCGLGQAQPFETPPQPGAPRALAIAVPTEATLANGLRVVVAPRRDLPLVTAHLLLLSGSEADPPQCAGLAAMTAALLTKGTKRHDAPALARAAEALGGSLDSGAGWNQSRVSISVTTPMLPAALALVGEAVMQPVFAQAELDRLRAQSLDEMKLSLSQPGTLATLAADRLLFSGTPYGHLASGTPASLPRISRADVQALHRREHRPDRAVLVLAGDIDLATGQALAQQVFGAWRAAPSASASPSAAAPAIVAAASGASRLAIDLGDSGQAAVVVALPLPARTAMSSTDAAVAQVTNAVIGGGYSSRLMQEIRIKRGLSYGADSALDRRRDASLWLASVQTKHESAAEVLGLVHAELDRLIATPVPDDELAARKATLIGGFSRSVETTGALAAQVSGLVVAGEPTDRLRSRIAELSAVTPAQVQDFASRYFVVAQRRSVVAGKAADFAAALKAQDAGWSVIPQSALDLDAR